MANQLVWDVYNLVRTVPEGVVVEVCCNVLLSDEENTVSGSVSQRVPYKSPSDPGFIPFDQLTEAETVQWVQEQLGPEQISGMQRMMQQELDIRRIKTANGVPW